LAGVRLCDRPKGGPRILDSSVVPLHRGGKCVQRGRIASQESACEALRLQVVPDHRRRNLLVKHLVQPAAKLIDDDFGIALDEHLVDLVHRAAKMISGMLLDVHVPEVVPRSCLVDLPATGEFAEPSTLLLGQYRGVLLNGGRRAGTGRKSCEVRRGRGEHQPDRVTGGEMSGKRNKHALDDQAFERPVPCAFLTCSYQRWPDSSTQN
jgi:hypothetical protein